MDGPMLTYAKDDAEGSPAKMVVLNSTSRCVVVTGKSSRENEFKILTTTDSSKRREICLTANSNYELTEWVCAIQAAINAGNKSAFEGSNLGHRALLHAHRLTNTLRLTTYRSRGF